MTTLMFRMCEEVTIKRLHGHAIINEEPRFLTIILWTDKKMIFKRLT